MICSFDPAISVRLAVAHHLELFVAKKKNGKILSHSADAKIGKTEGRDGSVCVEVRRRRSADGGHIY